MGADKKRREARAQKFGHLSIKKQVQRQESGQTDIRVATHLEGKTETPSEIESDSSAPAENIDEKNTADEANTETPATKKSRFICFVGILVFPFIFIACYRSNPNLGNLPFTATTESIAQHFSAVKPRAIRHRTARETGKSKGTAFLEFDNFDKLKTCLQNFHHSNFNDGISAPRKINVELR
jgi:hypothetical protein